MLYCVQLYVYICIYIYYIFHYIYHIYIFIYIIYICIYIIYIIYIIYYICMHNDLGFFKYLYFLCNCFLNTDINNQMYVRKEKLFWETDCIICIWQVLPARCPGGNMAWKNLISTAAYTLKAMTASFNLNYTSLYNLNLQFWQAVKQVNGNNIR